MIKIFETLQEYNTYTNNGTDLPSGNIYYVNEDGSVHFNTNNIDGEQHNYDMMDKIPEGYIIPTGNKSITANGDNIDVAQYATASVNVPIPEGYIVPTGNKEITENGTNIDVAQYATATVNIPSGMEDLKGLIEGYIVTLNIPSGTRLIKDYLCYHSSTDRSLTSVTIPNSVTSIGQYAFYNCSSLTSVTIPNSVTTIGQYAFQGCSSLTGSLTIPNSVTTIGQAAFVSCSGLTSITIPNSLTKISNSAFKNCSSLTNVVIPDSVTTIDKMSFQGCSGLTSVTVQATTPPTLGATNAFEGSYPIYVPAESVSAYQAAANWSTYADRIQAIS